jgi:Zn-dependent protease with chaperone function
MKQFLRVTILFFFIVRGNLSFCQELSHYQPIKIDTNNITALKFIDLSFKINADTLSPKDTTVRGIIIRQCSTRVDLVKDFIFDGDLYQNSIFDSLVKKVANNIVAANPIFKDKIIVLTSKSLIPNAFNLGNGIVVVNMGLLSQLQTEDQLALILCHEMAHDYYRHVDNAIYSYALKNADKELKRKIKKTLKERYNVNKKLEALLIPGVLEDMRYSRMDELLADSVGLNLLANTSYNLNNAITVIDILEDVDEEIKKDPLDLKKYFTIAEVPMRPSWYEYEEVSALMISEEDEAETELENAFRTHPDCKLRKEKLMEQLKVMKKWVPEEKSVGNQYLLPNRKVVDFEIAQTMYDQLKISSCVYFILAKLELYPNDFYLKSLLSSCFATYSEYQKKRNSSFVIGYNNSKYSENFNRVISFLNSISPQESSALSYWMIRPEQVSFRSNESYFSALLLSSYAYEKEDEYKKLLIEYNSIFQNGRSKKYIDKLSGY